MLSSAALYAYAVKQSERGNLAAAKKACDALLEREPTNANTLHMLGVIAFRSGNLRTAADLLIASLARQPNDHECNNNLGRILLSLDDIGGASRLFRRSLAVQPSSFASRANLAECFRRFSHHADVIREARRALTLSSQYVEALVPLADAVHHEDSELGLRLLKRALSLEPKHWRALWLRGLYTTGQAERIRIWRRVAAHAPDDGEVRIALIEAGILRRPMTQTRADELLFQRLVGHIHSGHVDVRIDLNHLADENCPVPVEFIRVRALIAGLGLAAATYWISPWAVLPAAALFGIAYFAWLRIMLWRWMRRYVVKTITGDRDVWDKLWRFGGVSLHANGEAMTLVSPRGSWREFAAQLVPLDVKSPS
jgi:cytochrome c-type biogenesis protein CcmH/NrfG